MPARYPLLLLVLAVCAHPSARGAEPFVPAPATVVLERAGTAGDPRLQELIRLRARVRAQPRDATATAAFVRAAIDLGRDRGDPRFLGWAQSALAPWSSHPELPDDLRLLRATLAQHEHRFADARRDLEALVTARPNDAQPRLMLAVILLVQGHPREALVQCRRMAPLASTLVAATCAAPAASLTTEGAKSLAALQLALALDDGRDPDLQRWSLTIAAEIAARRGDDATARRLFEAALRLESTRDPFARDVYLRAAWADFALSRQEAPAVAERLAGDSAQDPLLLRLAIAQRQMQNPSFASQRDELAARFALARSRGETSHLREEARFRLDLLDDPDGALQIALENWDAQQREPADAELVLRAARQAGKRASAARVLDWMRESGIVEPALVAQAGALDTTP